MEKARVAWAVVVGHTPVFDKRARDDGGHHQRCDSATRTGRSNQRREKCLRRPRLLASFRPTVSGSGTERHGSQLSLKNSPRQRHIPVAFRTLAINLVSPVRPWIRSAAVGELASFRRGPPGYFGQGVVAVTLDQKVEGSNPSSPAKGFSRSSPRPDRLTTPNTRYGVVNGTWSCSHTVPAVGTALVSR